MSVEWSLAGKNGDVPDTTVKIGLFVHDLICRWSPMLLERPPRAGIDVIVKTCHAKGGAFVTRFEGVVHRSAHMDAPLLLTENTPTVTGIGTFFGTCVVASTPTKTWQIDTVEVFDGACAENWQGDIHMFNTGMNHGMPDTDEYGACTSPKSTPGAHGGCQQGGQEGQT